MPAGVASPLTLQIKDKKKKFKIQKDAFYKYKWLLK
jgi:hypothetical protein